MPYTAAQLTQYYTAINGTAPDQATQSLIQIYAAQDAAGTRTDQSTLALVLNGAQVMSTSDVAIATYQFFTGATPSQAGLAYLRGDVGSGNPSGLNTTYYNGTTGTATAPSGTTATTMGFNNENRYYNFALSLVSGNAGAQTNFKNTYAGTGDGGTVSFNQAVAIAYEAIVGSTNVGTANANAAIASIQSSFTYFQNIATQRGVATTALSLDLQTKAVAIAYILEEAEKADVGTYAQAIDQFNAAVAGGTQTASVNLLTAYTPGGTLYNTGVGFAGGAGGVVGTTFALTAGIDTLTGTANNDTFNGAVVTNPTASIVSTASPLDSINGGAGFDTLNILVANAPGGATGAVTVPAVQTTGVELISVRGTSTTAADLDTVATGSFVGATTFQDDRSTNAVSFTGLAAGQAVTLNGDGTTQIGALTFGYGAAVTTTSAAVLNVQGGVVNATTAPAIVINSQPGAVTINASGGIATPTAANTIGTVQLATTVNTVRTLNVNASTSFTTGAVTGLGAITGSLAEAINITGAGAVTFGGLTSNGAVGFTSLAISTGAGAVALGGLTNTGSALTTATITDGGGNLNAGSITGFAANSSITVTGSTGTTGVTLGTIDNNVRTLTSSALTGTGGVTATTGTNTAFAFTGGAGNDVITVGTGTGATFAGTLNAGAGTDVIGFTTGADLSANLTTLVTGFETLRVSNGGVATTLQTYDPTLISGITSYQVAASTGSVQINNLIANGSVLDIGSVAGTNAAGGLILNLRDASGATDAVTLTLQNSAAPGFAATTNTNGLTISTLSTGGSTVAGQVETLNLVSSGTITGTGTANNVTLFQAAAGAFSDANRIVITGAAPLTLGTGTLQHSITIDGSAATGGLTINATPATFQVNVNGGSGNDTININGGATTSTGSVIYGGGGGDLITLTGNNQTVVYRAASDSVLDLTGVTTGDTSVLVTAGTTATVGASGTGTANVLRMDNIVNFTSGTDKIDATAFGYTTATQIAEKGNVTTAAQLNALLATTTLFQDSTNVTRGVAQIHDAGTGANAGTYVVIDVNRDGLFTAGTDLVTKLIGVTAIANGDFVGG